MIAKFSQLWRPLQRSIKKRNKQWAAFSKFKYQVTFSADPHNLNSQSPTQKVTKHILGFFNQPGKTIVNGRLTSNGATQRAAL